MGQNQGHVISKRALLLCLLLAVALASMPAATAQTRPNFGGRWTIVADKSTGQPSYGSAFTINQDGTTLTVVVGTSGQNDSTTYHLDGSETRHSAMLGKETQSIATWEGSQLVIVTRVLYGSLEEIARTLAFNAQGELVVITNFANSGRQTTTVYARQ